MESLAFFIESDCSEMAPNSRNDPISYFVGVSHSALSCIKDTEFVGLSIGVEYCLQVALVLSAAAI